jgi:hypothetical protein
MLKTAAKEAETYMRNGFKNLGPTWWEGKKWKNVVTMKKTETVAPKAETKTPATATETETEGYFVQNEKILVDERAFVFASACAGTHDNIPNLYVKTYEDKTGKNLTGENVYHLRVPGNVPTTQYWSVVAYDSETAAFIDNSQSVGIDSYDQNVKKNPDGSVDIYFGPTAPMGLETNWISTTKGRPFFVFFRNYSPSPDVLDRTSPWSLNDIERLSAGESKQAQEEKK